MKRALSFVLLLLCFLTLSAEQSRADTVVITGGSVIIQRVGTITPPNASFSLYGENLSVQGTFPSPFPFGVVGDCFRFEDPGCTRVRVSTGEDVFSASFAATYNGVDFVGRQGTPPVASFLNLRFTGGVINIPPELLGASELRVTAPFNFTGVLFAPGIAFPPSFFGPRVDITGQGIFQAVFINIGLRRGFQPEIATYTFLPPGAPLPQPQIEAIPEPATLALIGTGLLGIVGVTRGRRRLARRER